MNDIFSAPRFGALLRKEIAEHYKGYLMALGLLAGAIALWVGMFNAITGEPVSLNMQYAIFYIFYFVVGILFTSSIFSDMSNKKSATAILTLPASHFEKYLVKWLLTYALYHLVYVAVFYLIMTPMVNAGNFHDRKPELLPIIVNGKSISFFLLFALFHSIAFWGAIFFQKLHFVKTAFTAFVATMIVTFLNHLFLTVLIGKKVRSSEPFGVLLFVDGGKTHVIQQHASMTTLASLCIVLTLSFWVAAYYRLKEKQV